MSFSSSEVFSPVEWCTVVGSMTTPPSTFKSLSAGLFSTVSSLAPSSSGDSVTVPTASLGASTSVSNEIAVAVTHALQLFHLNLVASLHAENHAAPVSSAASPPPFCSVVSSSAMVVATSLSFVSQVRLDYRHLCLRYPPLPPSPALARPPSSVDPASNYGIICLHGVVGQRDLGPLVRQGVCCRPGSHSYSCEIGEKNYLRQVCGVSRLTVGQSACSRPEVPDVSG